MNSSNCSCSSSVLALGLKSMQPLSTRPWERHDNVAARLYHLRSQGVGCKEYLGIGAIYRWEGPEPPRVGRLPSRGRCGPLLPVRQRLRRRAPRGAGAVYRGRLGDGPPWPVFPGRDRLMTTASRATAMRCAGSRSSTWTSSCFRRPAGPLPDVLREYEEHPVSGVSRAWMGTSGTRETPGGACCWRISPDGFTPPEPNRSVKSAPRPVAGRAPRQRALVRIHGRRRRGRRAPPTPRILAAAPSSRSTSCGSTTTSPSPWRRRSVKFDRPQAGGGKLRGEIKLRALRRRNEMYGRPDNVIQQYVPALEELMGRLD